MIQSTKLFTSIVDVSVGTSLGGSSPWFYLGVDITLLKHSSTGSWSHARIRPPWVCNWWHVSWDIAPDNGAIAQALDDSYPGKVETITIVVSGVLVTQILCHEGRDF
jgi:hypothetical protein